MPWHVQVAAPISSAAGSAHAHAFTLWHPLWWLRAIWATTCGGWVGSGTHALCDIMSTLFKCFESGPVTKHLKSMLVMSWRGIIPLMNVMCADQHALKLEHLQGTHLRGEFFFWRVLYLPWLVHYQPHGPSVHVHFRVLECNVSAWLRLLDCKARCHHFCMSKESSAWAL